MSRGRGVYLYCQNWNKCVKSSVPKQHALMAEHSICLPSSLRFAKLNFLLSSIVSSLGSNSGARGTPLSRVETVNAGSWKSWNKNKQTPAYHWFIITENHIICLINSDTGDNEKKTKKKGTFGPENNSHQTMTTRLCPTVNNLVAFLLCSAPAGCSASQCGRPHLSPLFYQDEYLLAARFPSGRRLVSHSPRVENSTGNKF